MAYGWTDRQLAHWDFPAQTAAWRERALCAEHNAAYWRARFESTQQQAKAQASA